MHRKAYGPHVNFWRAWIGFNLSHSIGVALIAAGVLLLGLEHFDLYVQYAVLHFGIPAVTIVYLTISIFFWFPSPTRAISVVLLCFLTSALLVKL